MSHLEGAPTHMNIPSERYSFRMTPVVDGVTESAKKTFGELRAHMVSDDSWNDVAYYAIEVLDPAGRPHPTLAQAIVTANLVGIEWDGDVSWGRLLGSTIEEVVDDWLNDEDAWEAR